MFFSQSQPEAVHADDGEAVVIDFKKGAGMDGPDLVGGDGTGGVGDHGAECALRQADGVLVLHLRQLRIVVGGQSHDVVSRVAAGQLDVQVFVTAEGDHIVREPAQNLAEQTGGKDQLPGFRDVGIQGGADAGLHVIAGDGQPGLRLEQQSLQGGNGAFGGDRSGGNAGGGLEKNFFTGKFHVRFSFLSRWGTFFSGEEK